MITLAILMKMPQEILHTLRRCPLKKNTYVGRVTEKVLTLPRCVHHNIFTYLQARRREIGHSSAVQRAVAAVEGHVVRDEAQVSGVNGNAVCAEDARNFGYNRGSSGFHTVCLAHGPNVV